MPTWKETLENKSEVFCVQITNKSQSCQLGFLVKSPCPLQCQVDSYPLDHQRSPYIIENGNRSLNFDK